MAHSEAAFAYDVVRWESLAALDGEECEETAATMRRINIIFIMRCFMSFKNFSGVVRAPVVLVYAFDNRYNSHLHAVDLSLVC